MVLLNVYWMLCGSKVNVGVSAPKACLGFMHKRPPVSIVLRVHIVVRARDRFSEDLSKL